ncbi:MAG TPA: hypothetical protein VMF59_16930, partial [Bacteroidota bacterium]|nr:hypothetical protein [Bacteroidota bacterium]
RTPVPGAPRVRWSGVKLMLITLIIQSFLWLPENVIGLVRGYRFPWVNNYGGFVILAIFCGLIGLWLTLRMAKRLRLSVDPFPYYVRAFILLLVLTALLSIPNAELAVYPALSIVFLALAMIVPLPLFKGVFLLLTPYPVIRLVFFEYTGLFQRMLSHLQMPTLFASVMYNATFIVVYGLLSLPFVYAFAAVYRDSGRDLFLLKKFGSKAGLALACAGALVTALILMFRPVYGPLWEMSVSVTQTYTVGADSGAVNLKSGEYLEGIRCTLDGRDTTLQGRITAMKLATARPARVGWLALDTAVTPGEEAGDTARVFERRIVLHSAVRPFSVTVSYRSDRPFTAASTWVTGVRRSAPADTMKNKTFTWYSFPDTPLVVPVTFTLRDSQKVRETVEVVYDTLAYPLTLDRDLTYFTRRTVVDASSAFRAPERGTR